jgi:hexosaminidase
MGMFKLNRFHWHLTDNEAWRLDLKCYPNLARQSSFRGYKQLIPPLYGSGFEKSGGYYSREEVKDIIAFAKKLNIEVMPEIDLPAHSWALTQVMPELYDHASNMHSEDVGSYKNNTINPSLESTWNFLNNIIAEISDLFSFNIIHVGVDERPKSSWEGSPKIQQLMKEKNFQSFDEVQDYYMNRVINILKKKNKRTAAWNEAALSPHNDIGSSGGTGNIDKNCLIFAWEHPSVSNESVKRGFQTVMCPGQKTYFDMVYNNATSERGICWAATIEASEIHSWKPLKDVDKDYHNLILGIQGQLWSETITKPEYLDIQINPRLACLSEVAWCSDNRRGWEEFKPTLLHNMKVLSKLGWKYHDF